MERNTFKDGQRVRVIAQDSPYYGKTGVVLHVDTAPDGMTLWKVEIDGPDPAAYLHTHELEAA
jgi:hypothetical protein